MRTFLHVLVNTAVANVTTSFLWFALTFWVYLETESVLATGIIGGAYMLLLAVFGMVFGTLVDRFRKHAVMVFSGVFTLAAFLAAGAIYLAQPESAILDLGGPWFWLFSGIILTGAVVENLRNIALSTTVTLLVPTARHANANGLVGTVQGIAFIVTSALSGLAIGFVGMGWTLAVAIAFTAVPLVHLLFVRIPEQAPTPDPGSKILDIRGAAAAIRAVPGLFALILFSTFNNLIGGLYMALMDPYGLELFDVRIWGVVLAVTATGFLIGGGIIAAKGLGRNPIRTLLLAVAAMGLLGAVFTLREWWWLYALGIWAYMTLVPVIEAAEQTVIQKVVPFERQGRVFGAATALEVSTGPITSFAIAPIAEFWVIPYLRTDEGERTWSWLLGEGEMRGIALIFLIGGLIMVAAALAAFLSRSYRTLSAEYRDAPESAAADAGDPAPGIPTSSREAAGGVGGD
ncbi:MFS transporter [Microbacterium sp. EYE_5]|nr:MFS transporter [Microbacterium sp. EYE_382]MCK6085194.1 MFS transporter [Microbacterium sp. EYE_384]MCK6122580.1 MFS transporter [Microbacterium sp. EYE_80]MCK6125957.1 MFS transporter [Microbacterium sp. EYE_79]MCK6140878.1 MFS transporter [Microbacterium sp. EYE_39]MCK6217604.1 MFS transporter [Microbacterium sp. EYE_5]MCK6226911.1 MFS transporter [Microbacterium sp. EYE_77]MCK6245995.1 MFS transporter [Microbacterium sp. EYE_78]